MRWACLLSAIGLVALVILAEPSTVVIVEDGYFKTAPAYVRLRIRVQPHAANRLLTVGIVSGTFSAESDEDLYGEQSPRTRWKVFKDVPSGAYTAYAVVQRGMAETWRASAEFVVIGMGE